MWQQMDSLAGAQPLHGWSPGRNNMGWGHEDAGVSGAGNGYFGLSEVLRIF